MTDIEKLTEEYSQVMPKEEDLHGAALALVRLQDTYNVNITELAAGNIKGSPAFVEMTARDCLYLGKFIHLLSVFAFKARRKHH